MNRFQQRAAQVPRPIAVPLMLLPCAVAAYWWITYSGLYRVVAEAQLQSFESYYPSFTAILTVFLSLIPSIIAMQIIGGMRERERSPQEAAALVAEVAERGARHSHWVQSHHRRLLGLALTVGLAGVGVYFSASARFAGTRVQVDAAALERGEKPAGRFAELTGRFFADDLVTVSETNHTEKTYVPIVSQRWQWQPDHPARAYLELDGTMMDDYAGALATGHYEGMLTTNSLPGPVITALENRGHPAPDRYWVLEYRQTPEKQSNLAYAMYFAAVVIGLITAIGWAVAAHYERKRKRGILV